MSNKIKNNITKDTTKPKNKGGRKSRYISHIEPRLEEIAAWARDGLTDAQICELLNVATVTFIKYKKEKTELINALRITKGIADLRIENSLYKRALGFEYNEETTEFVNNGEGKAIVKTKRVTKKYIPPDTRAADIWLRNRKPIEWREKLHIEHAGNIDSTIKNMTEEEVDKRIAELEAKLKKSKKKE